MDNKTLEKIKEEYEMLRENAIEYLTTERHIFDVSHLNSKDTYELFTIFLTVYLPRLHEDFKKEAGCLPAAITTQLAMSLGWMDSQFNLLNKDFMGTIWGQTENGGTYERFTYSKEEQEVILNYLALH